MRLCGRTVKVVCRGSEVRKCAKAVSWGLHGKATL